MSMSKLLSAVVAAGFALGLSAAVAQNVDSDKDKAKGQEQIMQEKEGAAQFSILTDSIATIPFWRNAG